MSALRDLGTLPNLVMPVRGRTVEFKPHAVSRYVQRTGLPIEFDGSQVLTHGPACVALHQRILAAHRLRFEKKRPPWLHTRPGGWNLVLTPLYLVVDNELAFPLAQAKFERLVAMTCLVRQ